MGATYKKDKLEPSVTTVQSLQEGLNAAMQSLSGRGIPYDEDSLFHEDMYKRAKELDRVFHANLGQMTTGFSPAALMVAYTDWVAHLTISPNKRLQLFESAQKKWFALWQNIIDYLYKKDVECFDIKDKRLYKRFKHDAWKQWPYCAIAHTFLQIEHWWQEATNIRGLEKNHKDLMSFIHYQWLNALSPENSFLFNPVVFEKTIQSSGQNLLDSWNNAQEDLKRHLLGEKPVGTETFRVGHEVALTEGKVVYRNELLELIQYFPKTKQVHPDPVLFIPAWIMKYYILDLSPHNSMVRYLVSKGHTVFMISWKNPDARYRDYSIQDYITRGVFKALDAVEAITERSQVHAAGYCIGGTILTMAASYLARHHTKHLKSITLFAAQTDFEEAGELMTFIDENQLCYLEDIMYSQGYLRGDQMSSTFNLLRARRLIWSKFVQNYLEGQRTRMNDLMAWNADSTRLPYKMHSDYLRHLHLNNELSEGDYQINGEPVILKDIESPLFVVATEKDHIAPWRSVYKIHLYTHRSDISFVLANKGHNGGIISEPGHAGRSYRFGKTPANARYMPPDEWHRAHKTRTGSWWPTWHRWLAEHSDNKQAPPSMGAPEKGYEVLDDAPGSYVLEQ